MKNNQLQNITSNEENTRNIAYAYNLCVVLSKQIIDYDDKYYTQQVYNEILNNINLENFPKDDSLCRALTSLLNTLGTMDDIDEEKKSIEQKYQRRKKNALWNAVPSPNVILAGGKISDIAFNILLSFGTALMNYKKEMNSIEEEHIDNNLKLNVLRKDVLKGNRINLFNSAWELAKDHPIPDHLRLSENDVDSYNEVLRDLDPQRRYERLYYMKERFGAYPPFWFNLGEAAREVYKKNDDDDFKIKALNAFETFDKIHFVFLRQDIFAASCAISHISLLDTQNDHEKIKELLNKAITFSRDNFDLLQQCAFIALKISDIDTARNILKKLTNEKHSLDINGKLLSMIYNRYDYDKKEYDVLLSRIGQENVTAWVDIKPKYRLQQFDLNMNNPNYLLRFGRGD